MFSNSFDSSTYHHGYSANSNPSSSPSKLLPLFDDVEDSYPSDCESVISGSPIGQRPNNAPMVRMDEGSNICEIIKKKLVSSLSSCGFSAKVEGVCRNDYSEIMSRVKYQSFCLYSKGIEIKREGNANVKYAWYGGSKDELNSILSHGFSLLPNNFGIFQKGISLSPVDHPLESMKSSIADETGLRHMLLCRVILGNSEVISSDSGKYARSSDDFDSGIDNAVSPKKYIIWNENMNTHILPEFLVSFRGCQKVPEPSRIPSSDWMPFASLINDLSKYLTSDAIKVISVHHNAYRKHKITRNEMVQRVRLIAGDELLIMIIKSHRLKRSKKIGAGTRPACRNW